MEPVAEQMQFPEGYGTPSKLLAWTAVRRRLEEAEQYWLATTRPDGRPHVVPVDGVWVDDVWSLDAWAPADRLWGADPDSSSHLIGRRDGPGPLCAPPWWVPHSIVSVDFVKLLMRLLARPLAILRVENLRPQNVPGRWDAVIWAGAQVLGTICLGAMLLAIRKVARPSH